MVWNTGVPADSDLASLGAGVIRTLKTDLQTALTTEGVFPGATPATPIFRFKPRYGNTASRPVNDPVNPGTTYYNTDLNEWEIDSGTQWIALAHAIPSGQVNWYAGATIPGGWLLCNGQAVSRTTYANLFASIGIAHGAGDGATTFNLPDIRGKFIRGVDAGAGNDPNTTARTAVNGGNAGDAVGSIQGQATAKNGLTITDPGHTHPFGKSAPSISVDNTGSTRVAIFSSDGSGSLTTSEPAGTVLNAGDSETRPLNVYLNAIIKI